MAGYIKEELNIREVVTTSDEERCGVKWSLGADYATLGRKLRKDLGKVKNALPSVPSADAKRYLETGKLNVAGVELVAGDLTGKLYVDLPPSAEGGAVYDSTTDTEVVILVDTLVRPDFVNESLAREIVNRVQKGRKEAGLQATDDIDVYVKPETPEGSAAFQELFEKKAEVVTRTIKRVPQMAEALPADAPVFWQSPEDTPVEVGDHKAWLVFVKH